MAQADMFNAVTNVCFWAKRTWTSRCLRFWSPHQVRGITRSSSPSWALQPQGFQE